MTDSDRYFLGSVIAFDLLSQQDKSNNEPDQGNSKSGENDLVSVTVQN